VVPYWAIEVGDLFRDAVVFEPEFFDVFERAGGGAFVLLRLWRAGSGSLCVPLCDLGGDQAFQ
jgi:hypothetical protein